MHVLALTAVSRCNRLELAKHLGNWRVMILSAKDFRLPLHAAITALSLSIIENLVEIGIDTTDPNTLLVGGLVAAAHIGNDSLCRALN